MSDTIRYSVHLTPTEQITDENAGTHDVLASEVNKSLGGKGEIVVTDYSGTAAAQGYKDAAVNYKEAPDGAGGEVAISTESSASCIWIKNTGCAYSATTTLGDPCTTRSIKVTANSGAIILSVLDAGECFGPMKDDNAGLDASGIKVETVETDSSESAGGTHLAVEYLVVD
jgi:hypothetical protein